ncbi:MAG: peptidase T [Clostridia bacterium]|nr:peptidase T [Clostridia bacterium]
MKTIERFLKYVSYPTMSDENSETCPSSQKQLALAKELCEELKAIGLDASVDEHGYVYGSLAANCDKTVPTIGLIAHMDTSDECADAPIHPKTVLHTGEDILLNEEKGIYLSESVYPALKNFRGKHLIVTDGLTLLGADDKAGCAEIVSAVEDLITSGKPHGAVRVAFTPDEEIGRGADLFDVPRFDADYGYTVDGGALGELEYENFNAASAAVTIHGRSIHPGSAKGMMINAALLAFELNAMLPADQIPAKTEGYEGFFHLIDVEGGCEHAVIRYIIRDHDRAKFEEKKRIMKEAVDTLNRQYGEGVAELDLRDSYYNMKEIMDAHMEGIEAAMTDMRESGAEPRCVPIRGGTDGARLSFMGLPCPNLPTGGENYHSRFEYACVEDMETMTKILVTILTDAAK